MSARRRHRSVFAGVVVVLLGLHIDVWNHGRGVELVLGWIPYDLAYHLLWMLVAWGAVLYMTVFVWPETPAELERPPGEEAEDG